jgi:hypothetical protein
MPGLVPFLVSTPGIMAMLGAGSMIDQNVQSKNAIKNQQNMQTSEQAQIAKNQATAQAGLAGNLAANPGPATAANQPGSAAPTYSGSSIPLAGTPARSPLSMPGSGAPASLSGGPASAGGASLPPQVLAMLKQAISGQA